jgi:hypothetical protein
MKKQKLLFNHALLRHNKYSRKLQWLEVTGHNQHRQGVLRKHIVRLHEWLSTMMLTFKRATIIGAFTAAAFAAAPMGVYVQDFDAAVTNPFDLTNVGTKTNTWFVDLDNDRDLNYFLDLQKYWMLKH